jgi:lipoate-protein ligase B
MGASLLTRPAEAVVNTTAAGAQQNSSRACLVEDLGQMAYGAAWDRQRALAAQRKTGEIPDHLLFVEHPHVITLGRNAGGGNLLTPREKLSELGIGLSESDRGGDITYHGPGQVVGYPIIDLREWKRDVVAYVRGLEQVIIEAVAEFGIKAGRTAGATGVWVGEAKLAAIGIHISRWVTSHGFALNVSSDLGYFRHIIPCGLQKPVTSMEVLLGKAPERETVLAVLAGGFGRVFGREMQFVSVPQRIVSHKSERERTG